MRVELVAYTPNPDKVCAMAARTCISKSCPTLDVRIDNLRHALDSGHESVAEHAVFTFQVEGISRACSHQLVRHRLASYSQQSQRYVNMDDFEYVVPASIKNHEKTWDEDGKTDVDKWFRNTMEALADMYHSLIEEGIPEEDARYILPNACTTNITVSMNARELRHFFSERCCERAQWEIRRLAVRMLEQVRGVAPVLFEDAGPKCQRLGYCPEAKGCGRMKTKEETR